ncbi:patatin-like phospholipase family protein [Cohnella soli]|uniref:Patatin-like phospholipase family protein n=1 Tax=Cohnella soli TaxID=425005 RepID=A0ABW0HVX4_9BACL
MPLINAEEKKVFNLYSNNENAKERELTKKIACKRIGLALSGGGYRASFFHLGVLANLAEKNILKDISIISTVSGGSIIGGLYFIKLRSKLLEKKQLTHKDYVDIIKELEEDFTIGVSKKIREKLFLHPVNELRAVFQQREKLLARLYEKYFYKLKYTMSELQVSGLPKLIINATLLENGGPWYFSQYDMGQYESEIIHDSKGTLSYDSNHIYLRDAVAASSAVPGLFNYVKFFSHTSDKFLSRRRHSLRV